MNPTTSDQRLNKGTPVQVQNKRGVVTRSEIKPSYGGGYVAVNYIRLTHRFKRGFEKTGTWEAIPKPAKPQGINYSFIFTLP